MLMLKSWLITKWQELNNLQTDFKINKQNQNLTKVRNLVTNAPFVYGNFIFNDVCHIFYCLIMFLSYKKKAFLYNSSTVLIL